ncbi:MAG: polyprenyl synthetase family protein, partial [Acidimicrobiales bacterium]
FATACRVGALVAGAGRPAVEALTRYGDRLGMTFQIVDDVLDVVATDAELGKPAGNDLVEGVYTLPVIRALADSRTGSALVGLLGRPGLGPAEAERARELVGADGAVGGALAIAREFAEEAHAALAPLAHSAATEALGALGHHLVESLPPRPAVRSAG